MESDTWNDTSCSAPPGRATDARIERVELFFLPVTTRVPLKFGTETLTTVTCARVRMTIADARQNSAVGWGETPLSVQWAWPSRAPYAERHAAMKEFCQQLGEAWWKFKRWGHPLEIGDAFQREVLDQLSTRFNSTRTEDAQLPLLAALVCCAAFDIACHDAYGNLHGVPVYQTYNAQFMNTDLAAFLSPADDAQVTFRGSYPNKYLTTELAGTLPVWHLVGGLDPLDPSELTGSEPDDGYPVLLGDWIERDGLYCLKVKLRGNDSAWDYDRLVRVGRLSLEKGVKHLSADFNCTVSEPGYVTSILDQLKKNERAIFDRVLYIEQPFPYELEEQMIDVRSVASHKPLFLDESAHNWQFVKLGRALGWTGVALKTCKTQTGAILSHCWARAHGMDIMVQDLTNPMLAQIPHVLLAAHTRTIMGVESNSMQFYPEASCHEARVHPGLYKRNRGQLDLSTIAGPGFGYRIEQIDRPLPPPAAVFA